jgi:hypothetical protein
VQRGGLPLTSTSRGVDPSVQMNSFAETWIRRDYRCRRSCCSCTVHAHADGVHSAPRIGDSPELLADARGRLENRPCREWNAAMNARFSHAYTLHASVGLMERCKRESTVARVVAKRIREVEKAGDKGTRIAVRAYKILARATALRSAIAGAGMQGGVEELGRDQGDNRARSQARSFSPTVVKRRMQRVICSPHSENHVGHRIEIGN